MFASKSNKQETCCSKHPLVARVEKLSALNFYCCNFNGRGVPWTFPLEFVCKSRVESGVQCVTNGAEKIAKILFSLSSSKLRGQIVS